MASVFDKAFQAAKKGDLTGISVLKELQQFDYDEKNEDGMTLLMVAAANGHEELVSHLINNGAEVNAVNQENGFTPLFYAASNGFFEVVKILTRVSSIDVKAVNKFGRNVLMDPAQKGFSIIVEHLLDCGAPVNGKDREGHTALMIGASCGHKGVVQVLLNSGADVTCRNEVGRTALKEGLESENVDVVKLLIKAENEIEQQNLELFTCKCQEDVADLMKIKGTSLNVTRADGATPLIVHAEFGNRDVCKELINCGAPIDVQDKHGETALMKASFKGHYDIVVLLIEENAIIDLKSKQRRTALSFAVESGHLEVVKVLLLAGANALITDKKTGKSPLDIAKEMNHSDMINLFSPSTENTTLWPSFLKTFDTYLRDKYSSKRKTDGWGKSQGGSGQKVTSTSTWRDDSSTIKKELDRCYEKIASLETRIQDLTGQMYMEVKDEDLSHLTRERLQQDYLKLKELKLKAEKYAIEARQTAQRLSAENFKLREQLSQVKHAHELEWKHVLSDIEKKISKGEDQSLHQKDQVISEKQSLLVKQMAVHSRVFREDYDKLVLDYSTLYKTIFEENQKSSFKYCIVAIAGLPEAGKTTFCKSICKNESIFPSCSHNDLSIYEYGYTSSRSNDWSELTGDNIHLKMLAGAIIHKCKGEKLIPKIEDLLSCGFRNKILRSVFSDVTRFLHTNLSFLLNSDLEGSTVINLWDMNFSKRMFDCFSLFSMAFSRLFIVDVLSFDRDIERLSRPMESLKNDDVMTARSRLHYLLRFASFSISDDNPLTLSRCRDYKNLESPRCVIVANKSEDSPKRDIVERLNASVVVKSSDMGLSHLLFSRVLALNLKGSEAHRLQKIIGNMIDQSLNPIEMPLNWIFLRCALYRYDDNFYIGMDELKVIASECRIESTAELIDFLKLFTSTGSLLYFPEVLGSNILLNFCEFLKHLNLIYSQPDFTKGFHLHWKQCLSHGFLCEELSKEMWQKNSEFFNHLLCEVGMGCRLDDSQGTNYCDQGCGKAVVFLPSLLPNIKSIPVDQEKSLFITFNREYVPFDMRAVLIKQLVINVNNGDKSANPCSSQDVKLNIEKKRSYHSIGITLCVDENLEYHIELKYHSDVLEVILDTDDLRLYIMMKNLLVRVFHAVIQYFPGVKYEFAFMCPHSIDYSKRRKRHFFSFHPCDPDTKIYCSKCTSTCVLSSNQEKWVTASCDVISSQLTGLSNCDQLSLNDITEIANDLSYQTFSAKGSEHLSNSLTLEPKELYKLCWCLLISEDTTQCSVEQIRKHLHMDNLQDLNKIHKREVPALNILLESLHKWKSESLANTKQRLAFILWKCNSYFSKGIHMDARLLDRKLEQDSHDVLTSNEIILIRENLNSNERNKLKKQFGDESLTRKSSLYRDQVSAYFEKRGFYTLMDMLLTRCDVYGYK